MARLPPENKAIRTGGVHMPAMEGIPGTDGKVFHTIQS